MIKFAKGGFVCIIALMICFCTVALAKKNYQQIQTLHAQDLILHLKNNQQQGEAYWDILLDNFQLEHGHKLGVLEPGKELKLKLMRRSCSTAMIQLKYEGLCVIFFSYKDCDSKPKIASKCIAGKKLKLEFDEKNQFVIPVP